MEDEKVKLSIIILSYNTKELLEKCLESVISNWLLVVSNHPPVTNHQLPTTEIIVVDNGSTDGSGEYLKTQMSKLKTESQNLKLKIILNKENLGFAKGNNIGIHEAKGEYIMLLNSDTVVKNGALRKLVEFLDSHKEVGIVGPRLLNIDGTFQANCGKFPGLLVAFLMLFGEHFFQKSRFVRWAPKFSEFVDWLTGAAFVTRRKIFEKTGLLDEKFFMYMEEVEWFYRASRAGFKSYCLTDAEIIHLGQGSSKSGKTEPILNIYKGLLYFYKKHKSLLELILLRIMLKLKAFGALLLGVIKNDNYLRKTYGEAFKIS